MGSEGVGLGSCAMTFISWNDPWWCWEFGFESAGDDDSAAFLCLDRDLSEDSAALAEARSVSRSIRGVWPVGSALSRFRMSLA